MEERLTFQAREVRCGGRNVEQLVILYHSRKMESRQNRVLL